MLQESLLVVQVSARVFTSMKAGKNLYEVLGLENTASQNEIKKAYHKLALQLHPDKNKDDENASERFQSLQQVYSILADEEKRKIYDQTGSMESAEDLDADDLNDLYRFYKDKFRQVTEEDLNSFQITFRGSEEERQDLLKYYQQFSGNMDQVFQWQICSDPQQDSHRFMDMLTTAIHDKQVKRYKVFTDWCKQISKRPRPRDPLKPSSKRARSSGPSDELALVAQIRQRSNSHFGSTLAALESKYCK
ncbi:hypothetical protein WJX74_007740 [Apatococcus lobatus]|uniref:J domain-containing protein n=1 Tax=Apatococcus lobatus TaxID=904363 RepID=A0AAW1Q933_9CHLO